MAADRLSNANQLRFLIVGKCSAKATKQHCCWSFDNVLTQSWIRNIELCCNCSYGHWTFCLLQSLLSLQLALLIHSNSLFCVSFVLVKHLHSLQKSMPCVTLGASVTVLFFFVTIIVHLKYILLSLIESFVPNCNTSKRNQAKGTGFICPYCAASHQRLGYTSVRPSWSAVAYSKKTQLNTANDGAQLMILT